MKMKLFRNQSLYWINDQLSVNMFSGYGNFWLQSWDQYYVINEFLESETP